MDRTWKEYGDFGTCAHSSYQALFLFPKECGDEASTWSWLYLANTKKWNWNDLAGSVGFLSSIPFGLSVYEAYFVPRDDFKCRHESTSLMILSSKEWHMHTPIKTGMLNPHTYTHVHAH